MTVGLLGPGRVGGIILTMRGYTMVSYACTHVNIHNSILSTTVYSILLVLALQVDAGPWHVCCVRHMWHMCTLSYLLFNHDSAGFSAPSYATFRGCHRWRQQQQQQPPHQRHCCLAPPWQLRRGEHTRHQRQQRRPSG